MNLDWLKCGNQDSYPIQIISPFVNGKFPPEGINHVLRWFGYVIELGDIDGATDASGDSAALPLGAPLGLQAIILGQSAANGGAKFG